MGITTYPLNGKQYDARDAETYLCTRTSGVYSDEILFIPNGMNITVTPFLAWIKNDDFSGKSVAVTTDTVLTISPSEPILPRIDRIVLRFDSAKNDSELMVLKGTHASVPTPPSIERTPIKYDLCLCEIYVRPSATSISNSDITSTLLDESLCGLMRDGVTNIPTGQLQRQTQALLKELEVSISMAQNGSPVLQSLGIKRGEVVVVLRGEANKVYTSDVVLFNTAFVDTPTVVLTRKSEVSTNTSDFNVLQNIKPQVSVNAKPGFFTVNACRDIAGDEVMLTYNWIAIGKVEWDNSGGDDEGGDDGGGGGEVEDPYYDDTISGGTLFISNRPTTTSIASNAYIGRSDFSRLVIPNNIETINNSAFRNCTALQGVEIGSNVADVDGSVFEGCTALRYISVDSGNTELKSVDDVLMTSNAIKLLLYAKAKTETEYIIPNTVRIIYPKAFENCDNLTYVVIPSGVAALQESTFKDSQNLSRISIPASLTTISNNAFSGCLSLSDVYYSGTKAQWEDMIIGSGNDYLKNAVIHCTDGDINGEEETPIYYNIYASVSPEGSGTVQGAGSYESGTLATLKATANEGYIFSYWGRGAEHRATSEITVEVTENQSWVAYFIEGEEDTEETVTITANVEPQGAGEVVGSVGNVTIGSMSAIQANPNSGYKFKHWRFEDGTTNTENPYLFRASTNRTFVAVFEVDNGEEETTYTSDTWVGTVLYVGTEETEIETEGAYSVDVGLTEVIIPEGRTMIAASVFSSCSNLAKVTMPSTMSSIGAFAFEDCIKLTQITYNGTKAQWNNISKDYAFYSNITIHCIDGDINYVKMTLSVSPEGSGTVTTSPTALIDVYGDTYYVKDSTVRLIASANQGYTFKTWRDPSGEEFSKIASQSVTADTGIWVAVFEPIDTSTTYAEDTIVDGVLYVGTQTTNIEGSDYFYENRSDITTVIIPEGRTKIGDGAFYGCRNLAQLYIPSTLASIGGQTFHSSDSLTTINYNGTKAQWKKIVIQGDNEFDNITVNCTDGSLSYVKVIPVASPYGGGSATATSLNEGNSLYILETIEGYQYAQIAYLFTYDAATDNDIKLTATANDGYHFKNWLFDNGYTDSNNPLSPMLFDRDSIVKAVFESDTNSEPTYADDTIVDGTLYIGTNTTSIDTTYRNNTEISRVVIPSSVTEISNFAFSMCSNLAEVTIGSNVQTIGNSAFKGCKISEIDIPNSVTSIGTEAFYSCNSLNTVIIGSGVANIGDYAFDECFNISTVKYRGSASAWNSITIGSNNDDLTKNTVDFI